MIFIGIFIGWFITWIWYDEKKIIRLERDIDIAFDRCIRKTSTR